MLMQTQDGLYIVLISLHCLVRGHDLELGRDADTGGQVLYVVELAHALAAHPDVARIAGPLGVPLLFTTRCSAMPRRCMSCLNCSRRPADAWVSVLPPGGISSARSRSCASAGLFPATASPAQIRIAPAGGAWVRYRR